MFAPHAEQKRALILATAAFMVSFAIWGLVSGLLPILKEQLHLSASQASLLVAVPVIIGSLGRLPVGALADKFGGSRVTAIILLLSAAATLLLGFARTYDEYLLSAGLIGIAGTSFASGISFVSRWFEPGEQGTALGIFGAGNIGHSIAVFSVPLLIGVLGTSWTIWTFALVAALCAFILATFANDAWTDQNRQKGEGLIKIFFGRGMSWVLSLLYFQTFGGFVTLAIYLPLLLLDVFHLTPADAGLRTAVFVLFATGMRPLGGWLSDLIGGGRVLALVFAGLVPCGFWLGSHDLGYFTVGVLSAAVLVGLGNGAVFKLVPDYFPGNVGTVTGLVGAAGGMGGFFPPLVLGYARDHVGSYAPGFLALSAYSLICLLVLYLTIIRPGRKARDETSTA